MKRNSLQYMIEFIFKYVWLFCSLLIFLEVLSTINTSTILMKESSHLVLESVAGEVTGLVDGVLRLLDGLSKDSRISDISQPLFDRAVLTRPYQASYDLFMLALTDENANVISCDETEPPEKPFSLAFRDYMQRMFTTGQYQITDAFLAGSDNETMNYTIAVPIMKNEKVMGSVFGSIYFDSINKILTRNSKNMDRNFYMFGRENTVMVGENSEEFGKDFLEVTKKTKFFGTNAKTINDNLHKGFSDSAWEWGSNGLCYITYKQVVPTEWIILYRVNYLSSIVTLLPAMFLKICLLITLSILLSTLGRRYIQKHLSSVSHLVDRITIMQKELFQNEEQINYDSVLDLTQRGLTDQLTGLATRAVLLKRLNQEVSAPNSHGALFFIDLDDLKIINDTHGHNAGDHALLHLAKCLKDCEEEYGGIAARYGGDEFIYALELVDENAAIRLAIHISKAICTSMTIDNQTFSVHGSIGIALFPEHGSTSEDLVSRADLALYSAKQEGKNKFILYDESNFLS